MSSTRRLQQPLALAALTAFLAAGCVPLGEAVDPPDVEATSGQAQDEGPEGGDGVETVDDGSGESGARGAQGDAEAEDHEEDAEDSEEDPGSDAGDHPPVVAEASIWDHTAAELVDVQVSVYPLVRDSHDGEDYLAARIDFELADGSGRFDLEAALTSPDTDPTEIRLVDTEALEVQAPLMVSDGELSLLPVQLEYDIVFPGDVATWTGLYEDLGAESSAVLVPYFGLLEDVEVLEPEDLDAEVLESYLLVEDLGFDPVRVLPRTYPADVYRERDGGDVSIRDDDGQATLTMASDVLFDVDEHDLDDDADVALQAAAEELERLDGGELFIVGHTDDVLDEDHNQALSERRAESVHDRLDELTDLSAFEITVEGRNFQEPVADNETEEGRAQNRRVELLFELPELEDLTDLQQIGEPADPEGPVGTAGEVLEVTAEDGRAAEVAVEEVYRVDNLLVGRLSVEITQNAEGHDTSGQLAWPFSFGDDSLREERESLGEGGQVDAVTLLIGDSRVFPLEMSGRGWITGVDDDGEFLQVDLPWYSPLADRYVGGGQDAVEGTRGVVTVLWPLVSSEEVTIDVPVETEYEDREGFDPWRFEDVPVVDGLQRSEADADKDED
ncbi:OmpA family protein [Nesterenkonia sp. HG001]|uniref:OmpA family protein n=1 Tax=Nesterenkonia sp. HG001 TaxID=2983207 RepID=UPI002AC4CDAB|nr:OmpA family protein [Nesterenkonia sp. HG001]MDZ5076378.1 OmpA family protein [Nesterenkonia sp. HG001]